ASVTGASMPAAAQVAPWPGRGSTRATARPAWADRQAPASPITPPPTKTASNLLGPGTMLILRAGGPAARLGEAEIPFPSTRGPTREGPPSVGGPHTAGTRANRVELTDRRASVVPGGRSTIPTERPSLVHRWRDPMTTRTGLSADPAPGGTTTPVAPNRAPRTGLY